MYSNTLRLQIISKNKVIINIISNHSIWKHVLWKYKIILDFFFKKILINNMLKKINSFIYFLSMKYLLCGSLGKKSFSETILLIFIFVLRNRENVIPQIIKKISQ